MSTGTKKLTEEEFKNHELNLKEDPEDDGPVVEEEEEVKDEPKVDGKKALTPQERSASYKSLLSAMTVITDYLDLTAPVVASLVRDKENCGWTGPHVMAFEEAAKQAYQELEILGVDTICEYDYE